MGRAREGQKAPPDLATVAQMIYTELIGKLSNPLFSSDSTIAAKKLEMEGVYKTLSSTSEEMARYNAMLDAAAEAAAVAAATRATETKPPEEGAAADANPTRGTGDHNRSAARNGQRRRRLIRCQSRRC